MAVTWPEALVTEIAERRCVVILGAGASADCVDADGEAPPTWSELLLGAAGKFLAGRPEMDDFNAYMVKELLLEAAEVIVECAYPADYSEYLRDALGRHPYTIGRIYEQIVKLDARVNVSTNFDEILDNYCRNQGQGQPYSVIQYYEPNAIRELRSRRRLVLKAHGSVCDTGKLVLTRLQSYRARREHPRFFELLHALFLTNSLLFVGHSLRDPDLQLLLESVHMASQDTFPHYALVPGGRPAVEKKIVGETYNLHLLEYDAGQHCQASDALADLADQVESYRAAHPD